MQNVASLVLTSSRKKYVKRDEGLAGLAGEKNTLAIPEDSEYPYPRFAKLSKEFIIP